MTSTPREHLVIDGLMAAMQRAPQRVALEHGDASVSYASLASRVEAVAGGLQRTLGDLRGRTVAFEQVEPLPWLVAFLGIVHAGGIAAPLSPAWPAARRASALDLCAPALVLDTTDGLARIEAAGRDYVMVQPELGSDDPFYAGFTSGSTGEPRGVVRAHRAWVSSFAAMSEVFKIGAGDRVLAPGSLFFSFSLIAALHAVSVGATLIVPERAGARGVIEGLDRGATSAYVLPSLLRETLALAERRGRSFESLERLICAGEPLSLETREAVARLCPHAALIEYYGASELGFVTVLRAEDAPARPGSVGRAFPGSEIRVLDDAGEPLPPGETGLLCARTPYGGTHYLGGPALDDALDHHGWRTAGDLARMDADGYVTLAGRRDRMVVIHGENIYPEAAEAVLRAAPGVRDAAVVALPLEQPAYLVAAVEAAPDLDRHRLLASVREQLPAHRSPRRIVVLAALPRTATGKIDHAALPGVIARLIADR